MRRSLILLALLLAAPLRAALVVPEAGLPEGRLAVGAAFGVGFQPLAADRWSAFQNVVSAGLPANPSLGPWAALPEAQGRLAAAPFEALLSPVFWSDAARWQSLPRARRSELLKAFQLARRNVGRSVDRRAGSSLADAQTLIAQGRFGEQDLDWLSQRLEALAVHGDGARAAALEARTALALSKARRAAAALAPRVDAPVAPEPGDSSKKLARLDKAGKAARYAGYGLFGAAAVGLFHPAVGHLDLAAASPVLTWSAVALSSLSAFLQKPRGPPAGPASAAPAASAGLVGGKSFETFRYLYARAKINLAEHAKFAGEVGAAKIASFKTWIQSGLRAALSWFPLALGGMLGGALLGSVTQAAVAHAAAVSKAIPVDVVTGTSFGAFLNTFVASSLAQEVVFLGVVFNAFAWGLKKLGLTGNKALFGAIAASLAVYAPLLVYTGYPLSLFFTMAGIEAVILYVYGKSGSLLAAVGLRGFISLMSMESARMLAYLSAKPAGALVGAAPWATWAVGGLLLGALALSAAKSGLFTKGWAAVKRAWAGQLARLKAVGTWWTTHTPGAAPKSFWPMLTTGLLWALPLLVGMDAVESIVHWIYPQTAPTPEILARMLLMPFDVIAYNFVIVAALEEWVFRAGVFDSLRNRVKKWNLPKRWWFWPAAILSALIFSGAHYVDFAEVLHKIGIGAGNGDLASSLAGAYAFTWSSFLARAAGGLILAGLYAYSGTLMVPMIAHFGSNLLEGLGMRWGTGPLLLMAALVLLMQLRPGKTDAGK